MRTYNLSKNHNGKKLNCYLVMYWIEVNYGEHCKPHELAWILRGITTDGSLRQLIRRWSAPDWGFVKADIVGTLTTKGLKNLPNHKYCLTAKGLDYLQRHYNQALEYEIIDPDDIQARILEYAERMAWWPLEEKNRVMMAVKHNDNNTIVELRQKQIRRIQHARELRSAEKEERRQ